MSRTPLDTLLAEHGNALRDALPSPEHIYARARRRRRQRQAASSLLCALLVVGGVWLNPAYRTTTLQTAVGERSAWTLPDGSQVMLNTGSRLVARDRLRSRELTLEQGEVLFSVADGSFRDFVVFTPQARIDDIGTVFSVRLLPQATETAVREGAVLVTPHGHSTAYRLDAAQVAQVATDGQFQPLAAVEPAQHAPWSRGRLVFQQTPLLEVVAELQRYRLAPIQLSAPALERLRISGQFSLSQLEAVIDLLPTLAPLTVHRAADGSISLQPKESKPNAT